MNKNIVSVDVDENISTALGKMKRYGIHQLPVISGGFFQGMLELKNIVTKKIDPRVTKAASLMQNTPSIEPNESLVMGVKKLIQSGFRAIPVMKEERLYGVLSETDVLKVSDLIKKGKVSDIMSLCVCLTVNDNIGKVAKTMLYENVSRIPITENSKLVGTIGTLDMINVFMGETKMNARGGSPELKQRGAKDKVGPEETLVRSIMNTPKTVTKNSTIKRVSELLIKHDQVYVENEGFICIVTPKDVLQNITEGRGVFVEVTNIEDEDEFTIGKIHQAAAETVKKIGRIIPDIRSIIIHINRHQKGGGRMRYSVRSRMMTGEGLFVSHSWGWDLVSISQQTLNKMEREAKKKHGKKQSMRRRLQE
ncbi:CBS domain-containing protein [Candidatus Aenigmatarchaeota archaeon]